MCQNQLLQPEPGGKRGGFVGVIAENRYTPEVPWERGCYVISNKSRATGAEGNLKWSYWLTAEKFSRLLSSILVRVMERTIMKDDTWLSGYLLMFTAGGAHRWKRFCHSAASKHVEHDHILIQVTFMKVAVEQKK